jgi:hypothetical protein
MRNAIDFFLLYPFPTQKPFICITMAVHVTEMTAKQEVCPPASWCLGAMPFVYQTVLVCSCCYIIYIWVIHKQQKFISHIAKGWEVQHQGAGGFGAW